MEELTILNPFVVGKYVSPHFFCDREVETQWLMNGIGLHLMQAKCSTTLTAGNLLFPAVPARRPH